ncbi:hypothetical protein GCM10010172_85720 [Paractinoplanes ferrugineus]|uniref:STAS domain-containing protein n=1 Tax=Paractinoplanes ferrugineus TaxID=113564 RepID=A0A919J9N6_9ACTN|nr:STAS domain-containing protein [Actinoplanes ferrugineus]GIE16718.1 hypothetical protein Afe05nite_85580 [Actinoplanes ferrugineus]
MATPHFTITQDLTPTGAVRVKLAGEFDMSIGDGLSRVLLEAAGRPDVTQVIVDLEGTRFIDSHIVADLVAGYQAAVTAQRGFTVVNGRGTVQEVLDVTGLSEILCP